MSKGLCNITVLISGNGSNLQSIIDAIEQGVIDNGKIVLVVSDNVLAFGLTRAKNHGIPSVSLDKTCLSADAFNEKLLSEIKNHNTDIIVLAGYLSILPESIINEYKNRIINVHPSLIPKFCGKGYYGKLVHKAVLENKEVETGATVHFVDMGIDTGNIIIQEKVKVLKDDNIDILAKRVLEVEHRIIVKAVKKLCCILEDDYETGDY